MNEKDLRKWGCNSFKQISKESTFSDARGTRPMEDIIKWTTKNRPDLTVDPVIDV